MEEKKQQDGKIVSYLFLWLSGWFLVLWGNDCNERIEMAGEKRKNFAWMKEGRHTRSHANRI